MRLSPAPSLRREHRVAIRLAGLAALALGLWACGGQRPEARPEAGRVAVLEVMAPPGALTDAEAAWVAELVRSVAVRLPAPRFAVLTPGAMTALLGPGQPLAACVGSCEVETGRRLGADYVVSGEVLPVGTGLRVALSLHATGAATLLGAEQASANTVAELEGAVTAAATRLLKPLAGREAGWVARPLPGAVVRVEPGAFVSGSPSGEPGRQSHEVQTPVRIDRPFLLGATEVTQAEWRRHFDTRPSRFDGCDDCPVERVSFAEVAAWLNAASAADGLPLCYQLLGCSGTPGAGDHRCAEVRSVPRCTGWRLPTQDEWAYAARAGETGAVPGGALKLREERDAAGLGEHAWYGGNSALGTTSAGTGVPCGDWPGRPAGASATAHCGTHPVAGLRPNAWGLYDLVGNVAEWTDTGSGAGPKAARSVRGGGFRSPAVALRFAATARSGLTTRADDLGFRRCRTVD